MIRVAVISDLHFGYGKNTERDEDCWTGAKEAFQKAEDCDMIILPGDIFDKKIPRPEDWAKALGIFSKVKKPMVAIHGTHERRGRGLINCVEGFEHAGLLDHLHCESKTYEINGEKITVHGMSGVPEAYAKEVLSQWDPKPGEGYNIFMLHQSIHPYIYNPIEPPSLKLEDLPKGFDLYISGHIHWNEKTEIMGKPFIIPGSTVTTQVNQTEAKHPKGFYKIEIEDGKEKIEFVELENARKVFYRDFEVSSDTEKTIEEIDNYLSKIKEDTRPLVRIRVKGRIKKGDGMDFTSIKEKYKNRMILNITSKLNETEMKKQMEMLEEIRKSRASIEEMGMKILRDNLKEMGVDSRYENVFDLLVEGNIDSAMVNLMSYNEKEERVVELDKDIFEKELQKEVKIKRKDLSAWVKK